MPERLPLQTSRRRIGRENPGRLLHGLRLPVVLFSAVACCLGCTSGLDVAALREGPRPSIDGIRGPAERDLQQAMWEQRKQGGSPAALGPIAGLDEYNAAEALYKAGKYPEATEAFKLLTKEYKHGPPVEGKSKWLWFGTRTDDAKRSPIYEDSLFMLAECYYEQKLYPDAHDNYSLLLKEYPSTGHLDQVSARLFQIAKTWLDFPEFVSIGEIQQVDLEQPGKLMPPEQAVEIDNTWPVVPNFTDKSRPLFDTQGNALLALKTIWLNDPVGPLADDALMLTASHHARKGDFMEADRTFSILREEYPNSPHIEKAFVLGAHVKLMAYQGPAYEGRKLQEAEQLQESTLQLFPNLPERSRVRRGMAAIEEANAAREWEMVQLYQRKGKPQAVAVYCNLLIEQYPKSSFAPKARAVLEELGPEYAGDAWFMPQPASPQLPYDETGSKESPTPPVANKEAAGKAKL